jgi:ParB-like nuclease domain
MVKGDCPLYDGRGADLSSPKALNDWWLWACAWPGEPLYGGIDPPGNEDAGVFDRLGMAAKRKAKQPRRSLDDFEAERRQAGATERTAPSSFPRRRIPVADIVSDWDGVQAREALDTDTVEEYADAMKAGAQFPAIVVFEGADGIVLADGFSRHEAAKEAGLADIECEVRPGTKRDAALFAVGANSTHGQRRTHEDKRKAITRLLNDPEWSKWADREIARRCVVSHNFVSDLRRSLLSSDDSKNGAKKRTYTRRGKTGKMNTGKIGKRKAKPKPKPDEDNNRIWAAAKRALRAGKHVWKFDDGYGDGEKWYAILPAPSHDADGGILISLTMTASSAPMTPQRRPRLLMRNARMAGGTRTSPTPPLPRMMSRPMPRNE